MPCDLICSKTVNISNEGVCNHEFVWLINSSLIVTAKPKSPHCPSWQYWCVIRLCCRRYRFESHHISAFIFPSFFLFSRITEFIDPDMISVRVCLLFVMIFPLIQ